MIGKKLKEVIERVVGSEVNLEHPSEEKFGDFSSNFALKQKGEANPRVVAQEWVDKLESSDEVMGLVEKIDVAGPGFINFYLKKELLIEEAGLVVKAGGDYGKGEWGEGKRVLVEYSSPNIAKRFSVGHFRSTVIGQAVRNLYEFLGWKSVGDNHLGDWGTQFGMMIAAVEEKGLTLSAMDLDEIEALYVEFNTRAKEDETILEKAREAFLRLEQGEEKAREIWQQAVDKSMEEFERIYALIGVKIENAYGESAYEKLMPEVIREAKEKGVTRESEGAMIVEYEDLPPAMLVKSNGTTTYFTRDLATVKFREEGELKSDLYIYEVGEEQTLHFRQVFAAVEKLGWADKSKFVHVAHGLILGKDGKKMSTRKGTTVKVEEWLKEIIAKAEEINKESAQAVGVGAVKYFDLKHAPNTSYRFDMEEALKLDGDSGPYLQYALVRTKAILQKSGKEVGGDVSSGELNEQEVAVLRWLYRFPEMVEEAAKNFSPNLICSYLFELAQRYNGFYNQHQVIGGENEEFRLLLTKAVGQVLENGLGLLGIESVSKM